MKIGIVGLGLIGGSLGLDLHSHGFEILGVSRSEATCQIAVEQGVVDRASTRLELLSEAEVIFICTPIDSIIPTLQQLLPYLRPEIIVTDVGSVKASIVKKCSKLWTNFVGGHPMAGTEKQGIDAARFGLFVKATYVITPKKKTPSEAVEKVKKIAKLLGSRVYICTPKEHDRAVAWISHLPVMVSASLIGACVSEQDEAILELAKKLASSGFRDTSRVGGGNPELGLMMARYNRSALSDSLQHYRQQLDRVIDCIEQEDWAMLEEILRLTQQVRPEFLD